MEMRQCPHLYQYPKYGHLYRYLIKKSKNRFFLNLGDPDRNPQAHIHGELWQIHACKAARNHAATKTSVQLNEPGYTLRVSLQLRTGHTPELQFICHPAT
jgi:hypothetical protein